MPSHHIIEERSLRNTQPNLNQNNNQNPANVQGDNSVPRNVPTGNPASGNIQNGNPAYRTLSAGSGDQQRPGSVPVSARPPPSSISGEGQQGNIRGTNSNPGPNNVQTVNPTPRNVQAPPSNPVGRTYSLPVKTYVSTSTIVNGKLVSQTGELPPGCPPVDVEAILRSAGLGSNGNATVNTRSYSTSTSTRNVTVNGQNVPGADAMGVFDNFDKLFENVDKDGQPDPKVVNDFVSKFTRSFSLDSSTPSAVTGGQQRPATVPVTARPPQSSVPGQGQQGNIPEASGNPGGNPPGPGEYGARVKSVPPQAQVKQLVTRKHSLPVGNSRINICNGAKISGNRVFIGGSIASGKNANIPDRPSGNVDINVGDGVEIEAREELLIGCGNTRIDDPKAMGGLVDIAEEVDNKKKEKAEKEAVEKKMKLVTKAVCFITNDHGNTIGNGFFAEWDEFSGLVFMSQGDIFKDNMERYNLYFKSDGDLDSLGTVNLSLQSIMGHKHEMVVNSGGKRRIVGIGAERLEWMEGGSNYIALLLGPGFRQIIKDMDLGILKINADNDDKTLKTIYYVGHTRHEGLNGPLKFVNVVVESANQQKIEYSIDKDGGLPGGPLLDSDYCVRGIHVSDSQGKAHHGQRIGAVISDLYKAKLRIIRRSLDGAGRRTC